MIAHSCGVRQARELMRRHVRLVQPTGGTIALDVLYPHPTAAGAARPSLAGTMPQPSAPADVTAVAHG